MSDPRYLIGLGTTAFPENGLPARLTVVYLPRPSSAKPGDPEDPDILVESWQDGVSDGTTLPPENMLEYRPYTRSARTKSGSSSTGYVQEPAGWFERRCAEAGCLWFVPFV